MPAETLDNLGLDTGWNRGETGWSTGMDANLYLLDATVQLSVMSASTSAPPGTPSNGDRYILPAGATGAWATHDGKLAIYDSTAGGWILFVARPNWRAYVDDVATHVRYDAAGADWVPGDGGGSAVAGTVIDFTSDADITLTAAQAGNRMLVIKDTGGVLTVQRDINLPDTQWGEWVVANQTGQTLQVKQVSDGVGISLLAGTTADVGVLAGDTTGL